jgi:hypothetical protein
MELLRQLKAQFRVARRFVYWCDVSAGQILAKIIVRGESDVDRILRQRRQDCGQNVSKADRGRLVVLLLVGRRGWEVAR